MKRAARRWKRSLPWIFCACLVFGCTMAAYTYLYAADVYVSTSSFYALPGGTTEAETPLEASRMLARDCQTLVQTEEFRKAVLADMQSDGRSRVNVRAVDGTHILRVEAAGPDAIVTYRMAQTTSQELRTQAVTLLGAKNVREISPAKLPDTPAGPDRPTRIAWTVVITFLVCSAIACFVGSDKQTVCIENWLAFAPETYPLGAVVDLHKPLARFEHGKIGADGMLLDAVDRLMLESVRMCALHLRMSMQMSGAKSATLFGLDERDGSAPVAALMAGELARQGFRVLLVELDGERSASTLLRIRGRADLYDYLSGRAGLGDVVVRTAIDGLSLIDCGHPDGSVASFAATPAFQAFVLSAETNFDYVLFHTATLVDCADAPMLASVTGTSVLLAKDGGHTADVLTDVCRAIAPVAKHFAGVVFTSVSADLYARYDG